MNSLKGITLVELLIAMAITAVIGLGAVNFQKNSAGIATSGIANINMMKQASIALETIHDDLKHACIPYKESFSLSFGDMIQVEYSEKHGLEGAEFSFFKMASDGGFVPVAPNEKSYKLHPLAYVKYSLKKAKDSELLCLVRYLDEPSEKPVEKIIAEKVSFFNIVPVCVKTDYGEKWLWNVILRLSQKSDKSQSNLRGEHTLDFYDVVYPDFYRSIVENVNSVRNWNTGFTYTNK